jgi:cytochrome c oxidase subunit 3
LAEHDAALAHHFEDLDQQREAAELGMWLFLITEFMFFGGLFMAYLAYRFWYPVGFAAASHTMNVPLGTINTAVLLTSSLTMAIAVHAARENQRQRLIGCLLATMLFGLIFLGIKAYEYHHKYEEHLIPFAGLPFHWEGSREASIQGVQTFLNLYFLMTGVHAFHMVIGLVLLAILVVLAYRSRNFGHATLVHNIGLYWHFVDLVWVYLFPFFYLVAMRSE